MLAENDDVRVDNVREGKTWIILLWYRVDNNGYGVGWEQIT